MPCCDNEPVNLWSRTAESIASCAHDWRGYRLEVRIDDRGAAGGVAVVVDRGEAVINVVAARWDSAMQGVQVHSNDFQASEPVHAGKVLTTIAPLRTSTWRDTLTPERRHSLAATLALDQIRAEAGVVAGYRHAAAALRCVSSWRCGPLDPQGGDDAIAARLAESVLLRCATGTLDANVEAVVRRELGKILPATALDAMGECGQQLAAADDDSLAVTMAASRWRTLLERHLPRRSSDGAPNLLADSATAVTTALVEADKRAEEELAPYRTDDTPSDDHRSDEAGFGIVGLRSGLPDHDNLRYRPARDSDLELKASLTEALRGAHTPVPVITTLASNTPRGRAQPRELVQLKAQQARGAVPTATPWRRLAPSVDTKGRELTVAAVFDASVSMRAWLDAGTQLMWALTAATREIGGKAAAWCFGGEAFELIRPDTAPRSVPYLRSGAPTSSGYADAVHAVAEAVRLDTGTGPRILLVVTDGALPDNGEYRRLQKEISRLATAGVRCLWIATSYYRDALEPGDVHRASVPSPESLHTYVTRELVASATGIPQRYDTSYYRPIP